MTGDDGLPSGEQVEFPETGETHVTTHRYDCFFWTYNGWRDRRDQHPVAQRGD